MPVAFSGAELYSLTMDKPLRKQALLILSGLLATAVLALAWLGWIQNGSTLLLSLAQSGLSWCF